MPLKFNPFTGNLDFVGLQGPSSATDKGIARYNGTNGQVVQDSPYAIVQDGGAVQAQEFVFQNVIANAVVVPANSVMFGRDMVVDTGDVILNNNAELLLL